ncbi:MAG: Cu+-exporting ATPase [Pedosphaera sp.]|nr:Cu+-exporting ATPase [Pedosphaera sp.]
MASGNTNHSTQTAAGLLTELSVNGMTCGNCARHVTEAIQSVPGVTSASVRLDAGRAAVRWQSAPDLPAVVAAVQAAGYEATPLETEGPKAQQRSAWSPLAGWQFNVVVGLAVTLPLIIGEWIFGLGMTPWFRWLAFALTLPVQIFCGARFYIGAWRQLKVRDSNMDTLVALGSTTAFGYSVWALFTGAGGHLYFMESAAIITLISLGHWIEARTSAKAEGSLQALLHLAPQRARRRNADGSEVEVPVRELQVNDTVVLKPGDHVPTDGEVSSGDSTVDESMLTGESLPVNKHPGDKVFAGTVNLNGQMLTRVTGTGEATALAHIIAAVARAQTSRAEIQRLGDRVSSVFVPIVVLIALATGLWWGLAPQQAQHVSAWLEKFLWPSAVPESVLAAAFIHAAAVLIIACPCAMGLATPAAIMAGTNAAARRGILIRDGMALERAGRITALIFDKTGTLTQGKPVVVSEEKYVVNQRRPAVDEMKLAAALARRSSHPLSQAIAKLHPDDFPFTNWEEIRGAGVQARLSLDNSSPVLVRLGSLRWLREAGVDLRQSRAFEEKWSAQGATLLGIAANPSLLGVLAVQDTLKPGAADVTRQLQNNGLHVYLVTGDNLLTAQAIAKQAGIPSQNVFAEVRPEQKAKFIEQLRAKGERVAFVGDGINDAPALEAADLGIAVSRASDVAREAADIILLNSEIEAVPEALGLSQATLRTIKQNLFWAFFYNAVGIPLAAFGFMSPILCAAAMGLSDLVVIGNALRLLRWRMRR